MSLQETAWTLFNPQSIALIGASATESKYSSLPQRFLRKHGYAGRIYPINPGRDEIFGEKAYPSVVAVGASVDHAFIMLPTDKVEEAVNDCAAAGVRSVTILSNGFAETGPKGLAVQQRMTATLNKAGGRLLGPNSFGVINTHAPMTLSANEVLSLPSLLCGRNALISQSGSMLGALLSRGTARGVGFSKMVSVGNEADIGVAELIEMIVQDQESDTILLFLETIRDADRFAKAARLAFEAGKPVIAFLLGRSALGQELAASHTGAMTGNGAAIEAFLADCGVVRVDHVKTLIEIPPLLRGRRPVHRRQASIMATTGGGGGLVIEALEGKGVTIVPPDDDAIAGLAAQGITIHKTPLIDLTLAGANTNTYGRVMGALLASPATDLVIGVVGSSAQFRPDRGVEPIVAAQKQRPGKPIAVFATPHAERSLALLLENGVAAFESPESCADAIRAFFDWRAPVASSRAALAPDDTTARLLGQADGPALNAVQARQVFASLGIAQPGEAVLPPDPARWTAEMVGLAFPVVAKILSPDIQHKTEVGGVVLNLQTFDELKQAGRRILDSVRRHRPDARLEGIHVEQQVSGLAQVLVGYRRDPQVGPTILVGAGGVLAELYRDFAIRLAPVSRDAALEMIDSVRSLALIKGYRNLPLGDVDALAEAIVAVSRLAFYPAVAEAEINPLIVRDKGKGAIAVDGLVALKPNN